MNGLDELIERVMKGDSMRKQSTNTRGVYNFAKSRGKPSCVIIV